MALPIVLQEGCWARCCGLPKHLEDKLGAQSLIKFSALFGWAQVLWRVCGQQSEWVGAKVTHGSTPRRSATGLRAEAVSWPSRGLVGRIVSAESLSRGWA